MPLATLEAVQEFVARNGIYRLACEECDREDFDGVRELPTDWKDIAECQPLRDSLSVYEDDEDAPKGYSVREWWTHLGVCPDCKEVK